ncbi:MAG: hypothetical protein M1356_02890 [Gammaproteobacteria bacterium]|nr:hypothetical protein [Gammaproteobacteria bacterium]
MSNHNLKPSTWRRASAPLGLAIVVGALTLAVCSAQPAEQTRRVDATSDPSSASIARRAFDFRDADIRVPNYFNTQGLDFCTFDVQNEHPNCPLYRPIVRMYFDSAMVEGEGFGVDAVREFDTRNLLNMLENQFAGINRFRIVTRDDQVVSQEFETFRQQQGEEAFRQRHSEQRILAPDFVVKLDTLRSVKNQGSITGWMDYGLEITASVLNPFTRELMAYPNLGKVRVESADVRDRRRLEYVTANDRYVSGFRYFDSAHVNSILNDMASRGIDILLTRMLAEMPATAQVVGIRGDQISLDRGQNAGVLPNETIDDYSRRRNCPLEELSRCTPSAGGSEQWYLSSRCRTARIRCQCWSTIHLLARPHLMRW